MKSILCRGVGAAAIVVSALAFSAPSAAAVETGWDVNTGWDVKTGWDANGWDAKGWDVRTGWDAKGWDVRGWD